MKKMTLPKFGLNLQHYSKSKKNVDRVKFQLQKMLKSHASIKKMIDHLDLNLEKACLFRNQTLNDLQQTTNDKQWR